MEDGASNSADRRCGRLSANCTRAPSRSSSSFLKRIGAARSLLSLKASSSTNNPFLLSAPCWWGPSLAALPKALSFRSSFQFLVGRVPGISRSYTSAFSMHEEPRRPEAPRGTRASPCSPSCQICTNYHPHFWVPHSTIRVMFTIPRDRIQNENVGKSTFLSREWHTKDTGAWRVLRGLSLPHTPKHNTTSQYELGSSKGSVERVFPESVMSDR